MFQGYRQETLDFLWGIRFNNDRTWFQAHKEEYLRCLYEPTAALGEEVYDRFAAKRPKLGLDLHISRIYRDARRLYGRGPYKDHLWFTLRRPKEEWVSLPAFYFEIAPEYYSFGMGCYDATPVTMAKLRARIDRDPKPVEQLARKLEKSPFQLEGELYKRPKGDPGPLLAPWYNRKSISFARDENCEGPLFQPELADQVLEGFRFLKPYYDYMLSLAGDPAPEGRV